MRGLSPQNFVGKKTSMNVPVGSAGKSGFSILKGLEAPIPAGKRTPQPFPDAHPEVQEQEGVLLGIFPPFLKPAAQEASPLHPEHCRFVWRILGWLKGRVCFGSRRIWDWFLSRDTPETELPRLFGFHPQLCGAAKFK